MYDRIEKIGYHHIRIGIEDKLELNMSEPNFMKQLPIGQDEGLTTPLNEQYTGNHYLREAKVNIKHSRKWGNITGILGIGTIFMGLSSMLFRYVVMHWEFEQASEWKWIVGFVYGFLICCVGVVGASTWCCYRAPTIRLVFGILVCANSPLMPSIQY